MTVTAFSLRDEEEDEDELSKKDAAILELVLDWEREWVRYYDSDSPTGT